MLAPALRVGPEDDDLSQSSRQFRYVSPCVFFLEFPFQHTDAFNVDFLQMKKTRSPAQNKL